MIIDSRIGGLGDVWMRLLALYSLARLTNTKPTILINPVLVPLARSLFGERIEIGDEGKGDVIYTHLGLRHLIGGIVRGRRYILPFYQPMRANRKKTTLKHRLNDAAILGTAKIGLIRLTDPAKVANYEGYTEISALPPFDDVGFEEFSRESSVDFRELQLRLKRLCSNLAQKNHDIVVYPSGSAHQIMPVAWAEKHLPGAVFAFHQTDSYAREFEQDGLKVERFESLDELFSLGLGARRIVCTDSFPSHLWQVYTTHVLLLMAEQAGSFVVHPAFPQSQILASRAPCCPCVHLNRGPDGNSPCETGHSTCLTWWDPRYEAAFEKSLSS